MAKWSFNVATWTPVAVADATNFTDAGYCALQGGSSTQRVNIYEIVLGGQAGSSAPCILQLARDSTVGASITALSSPNSAGPLDASTAALAAPVVGFVASSTKPQRSSSVTLGKLNLSFNAFGGFVRWQAPIGRGVQPARQRRRRSVRCRLGRSPEARPGLLGSHILFEPLSL